MITIEVNGIEYSDFISINYRSGFLEFNNECSFTFALGNGENSPFTTADNVVVKLDGKKVMTGYIYLASISYTSNSHELSYSITDNTKDFADSDIDAISTLSSSLTFEQIIEAVLDDLGLTNVKVVNMAGDLGNFVGNEDIISPEVGDSAFDFCEGLSYKKQVVMRTNADGNIELVKSSDFTYSGVLQNKFDDTLGNNITSASYTYNISESYRRYIVKSATDNKNSKKPYQVGGSSNVNSQAEKDGFYEDKLNRRGRQKVVVAPEKSFDGDNEFQAKWLAAYGRTTKIKMNIDFGAHSLDGTVLRPNALVRIFDDFFGFYDYMLIESIDCTTDLQNGDTATITLVDKDSFKLSLIDPSKAPDVNTEKTGLLFNSNLDLEKSGVVIATNEEVQ